MAVPVRMCVVCRNRNEKGKLLRVVHREGRTEIDGTGKALGRGAYVCINSDCANRLKKGRHFNRAFKCQVEPEIYDRIAVLCED